MKKSIYFRPVQNSQAETLSSLHRAVSIQQDEA